MENIHKTASEINVMLENAKGVLIESDLVESIVNNVHTHKVHYSNGKNYTRTFYMNGDKLYVAVSEKDLSKHVFYLIVKK